MSSKGANVDSAIATSHVRFRNRRAAVAASIARLPGRTIPIKGWTQVTELLHRSVIRERGEFVHETPYGVRMSLDLDDYVQRNIFYDAWEGDELNLVRRVLRPRDVMIDVGANVGLFSLVAARAVGPDGSVHAFEPVPGNWRKFEQNLALNPLGNVHLNRVALSDHAGAVTLAIDAHMAGTSGSDSSGFFTLSRVDAPVREVQAQADTLDGYVEREIAGRPIRLVKIDVEGAEPLVLGGMKRVLSERRADVLVVELSVYALNQAGFTISDLVQPLERAGYALYRLGLRGLLWRWSYSGEPSIPHRSDMRVNVITGVYRGLQDLGRLFNLVAIRGDHPAVASRPRLIAAERVNTAR